MKLLLDTHLLLCAATHGAHSEPGGHLSGSVRKLLEDESNELFFSAASIWEVTMKNALGTSEFRFDPHVLSRGLLDNGYQELKISSAHAAAVSNLPKHHGDPFDGLLLAQAQLEGMLLVTNDRMLGKYPGSLVKLVK